MSQAEIGDVQGVAVMVNQMVMDLTINVLKLCHRLGQTDIAEDVERSLATFIDTLDLYLASVKGEL